MPRKSWEFTDEDLRRLDHQLYVPSQDPIDRRLRELDSAVYGRSPPETEVLLPEEIWAYWIEWGRQRIREGRDIIIVIDADRRSGGATRIGKSTLGLLLLKEWDPSFRTSTIRQRYATGPVDLAIFEKDCRPGQGVLYDEGMWGGRGRDAMSPENKMLGEILGTLASRQAIVVICSYSMLRLDADVRGLASLRLLVRRRGLAEVHLPKIHFDLENPRLLPFRQAEMSPIVWDRLDGPMMDAYEQVKRDAQDRRIELKLHEQAVFEARRLGLSPKQANVAVSAGEGIGAPSPPPALFPCEKCGKEWGDRYHRDRHQVTCPGRAGRRA